MCTKDIGYHFPMVILSGLVCGGLATLVMDLFAVFLIRANVLNLQGMQIVPSLLGRWVHIIMGRRQVCLTDIRSEPFLLAEARTGMITHYLIGFIFGAFFVFVAGHFQLQNFALIYAGIIFGFLTNIFPWLIMYPAMGFGVFGRKLAFFKQILLFSLINHLIYGFFLGIFVKLIKILEMTPL